MEKGASKKKHLWLWYIFVFTSLLGLVIASFAYSRSKDPEEKQVLKNVVYYNIIIIVIVFSIALILLGI